LDLDVVDHLGDAGHHLVTGQDLRAGLHQLGDRATVARAFEDEVGDDRNGLGVVQLDAAIEPAPRHDGRNRNQKLVLFARGQVHAKSLIIVHQFSHSRGNAAPVRASTAIMSARKPAASWAQNRAIAKPFHADIPTSPEKDSDASRMRSTRAPSPGTIRAVPIAAPPLATAERVSFAPMLPSSLMASTN